MLNASVSPAVPRLAATVMLVRERTEAGFEVWLARRSLRSRFMPGASVFPGGAVDAADGDAAARAATVDDGRPGFELRHAALRELVEEAGVALLCTPSAEAAEAPSPDAVAALRSAAGSLDAMLTERGLRLDARALVPYSNWVTPQSEPIRFDTHFFLARAPAGAIAEADGRELHDGEWSTPAAALAAADAGKIVLTFPTRAHVERLAGFATVTALFAHARARTIVPLEVVSADLADPAFAGSAW